MLAMSARLSAAERNALTDLEKNKLRDLERRIEKGMTTFKEVGYALLRIREERLYRERYNSFKLYCHCRWGFTRQRGQQLIDAAKVVQKVATVVDIEPANERQARIIAAVPEELQVTAWKEVVETAPTDGSGQRKITSEHVENAVLKFTPKKPAGLLVRMGSLRQVIARVYLKWPESERAALAGQLRNLANQIEEGTLFTTDQENCPAGV